MLVMTR